jgi:uncharacterized protein (DUF1810 family)
MEPADPCRLERFVAAQDRNGTYERAVAELRDGEKRSHWMWFVFPQISGLGFSAMSREFSISGPDEARAYLRHPVLGPRLVQCARIVAAIEGSTATDIFGSVDAMKLRSSMTLFRAAAAAENEPDTGNPFADVLVKYFAGAEDEATRSRLGVLARPLPDRQYRVGEGIGRLLRQVAAGQRLGRRIVNSTFRIINTYRSCRHKTRSCKNSPRLTPMVT